MNATNNTQAQNADNDLLNVKTSSYAIAYAYTAIFNGILVLFKENFEGVHNFMASLGHHWVTHGVFDLVVFFGLGIYFSSRNTQITVSKAVTYMAWATIIGGGMIAIFNLFHFFA